MPAKRISDDEKKILVIGDLHGEMPKIHFKRFDAIICVGDFCYDKKIRKYVMQSYRMFLKDPSKHKEWWEICKKKKAKELILESIGKAHKILQKLEKSNVPIFVIPGNWDFAEKDNGWKFMDGLYKKIILKDLKNVKDVHSKVVKFGQYSIIGYGLVNGPELLKHRDYKGMKKSDYVRNEKKYRKKIAKYNQLFANAKKNKRPIIFLSHNVPFDTRLDKIVNKDSPRNGYHFGSNLVREMIEKHKPILNIAGHMHEHYGTCKIGKTIVLNAGFGGQKNTLIVLEDGKIKKIMFHGKKC